MSTPTTRRSFIKASAASAGLFSIVPRHVLGCPGYTPASEQITQAVIGVGGMAFLMHQQPTLSLAVLAVGGIAFYIYRNR